MFVGRLAVRCSRAVICATSHDLTHLSSLLQSIFIPMIGINIPLGINHKLHLKSTRKRNIYYVFGEDGYSEFR